MVVYVLGSGPPPALPQFSEQLADVPFGVGLAQAIVNVGIDVKKTHGLVTPQYLQNTNSAQNRYMFDKHPAGPISRLSKQASV